MHSRGLILRVVVAVYGMSVFFSIALAQPQGFLADRHASYGASCQSCHGSGKPTSTPMKDSCLTCHGSYTELAQKTAGGLLNPHQAHLGEPNCTLCHHGHEKSVNACAGGGELGDCHGNNASYQFDVP